MGLVATDLIQLVSLPLEIVGLLLTIIEIFQRERHPSYCWSPDRQFEVLSNVRYGLINSLY